MLVIINPSGGGSWSSLPTTQQASVLHGHAAALSEQQPDRCSDLENPAMAEAQAGVETGAEDISAAPRQTAIRQVLTSFLNTVQT